jgi:MSHA biogenesis protein MshK
MAGRLMRALSALLALVLPLAVGAQIADPTRPPVGVAETADEAGAATGPVLQSVLIPKNGRPLAVIDGQQVRLGERLGERRLVRLSEREAVLDGPLGIERLQLTPGVEKTNVVAKKATKTPARGRAQGEGR